MVYMKERKTGKDAQKCRWGFRDQDSVRHSGGEDRWDRGMGDGDTKREG